MKVLLGDEDDGIELHRKVAVVSNKRFRKDHWNE